MFIYALIDPRTEEIRYIGKTVKKELNKRLNEHLCRARKKQHTDHKSTWIRSLLRDGVKPEIRALRDDIEVQEHLVAEEISMIAFCKEIGMHLTNSTDGGEGCIGYKHDEATRAKISAIQKGKKRGPRGPMPEETKRKLSLAKMGRPTGRLGVKLTEEQCLANSRGQGGKPFADQNGVVYQTQSEAARKLGVNQTEVFSCLHGKRNHTHGYSFKYLDGSTPSRNSPEVNRSRARGGKDFRCIENGKVYHNQSSAALELGVPQADIHKVLYGMTSHTHGYHLEFVDGSTPIFNRKILGKKFKCIENGKVYDNQRQAADDLGVHQSVISNSLNGKNTRKSHYHFQFLEVE